jgi:hypothetical protein
MNMRSLLIFGALLVLATPTLAQNIIPGDASPTCAVDSATFNSWFKSGSASQNGAVTPTDGFNFPPAATNTKCDFYTWGAQMFLWLTSPAGTGLTFDSDQFYDVVRIGTDANKNPIFEFQVSGSDTPNPMALRDVKGDDIHGNGQAGGGDVLISQPSTAAPDGSLTYYGIHANDIYAQYRTGQAATPNAFASTAIAGNFPTTQADVNLVAQYAGMAFADENAMTMEMKTSWVDAATVNADDYLVIEAIVPAYTKTSASVWTANGTEAKKLALVGMHIAAPVLGHPELVWISYEHINNAPMADYTYTNTGGSNVSVPFSSAGNWTFLPSGAAQPPNVTSVATVDSSGNINGVNGGAITAVDDVLENPWGVEPGPNADIANNTDLVSLNSSVLGMLAGLGDVRANYYQIGGIWTADGQLPTSDSDTNIRGGTRLANSTMETFHQYPDTNNGFQSKNCFLCHSTGSTDGVDLSHIFNFLNPL